MKKIWLESFARYTTNFIEAHDNRWDYIVSFFYFIFSLGSGYKVDFSFLFGQLNNFLYIIDKNKILK